MVLPILISLIYAIKCKASFKSIVKEWSLYPFILTQILLLIAQLLYINENFYLVAYADFLKLFVNLSLLVPFFKYGLFKSGFIGATLIFIGTFLNKIAINQNAGKMPVFPTISYLTGYVNETSFSIKEDTLHVLGSTHTKFVFLCDIIDTGYSILSIGDVLIHGFTLVILLSTIKKIKEHSTKKIEL